MSKLTPTRYAALLLVAGHFDTQEDMAAFFNVTQPTVSRWLNQSKQLPAEHVLAAERETGVSRHHLRPDIYPIETPHGRFHGVDHAVQHVGSAAA